MMILADALALLATHADVIQEIVQALEAGADKQAILDATRAAMVAASDAAMKKEAGVQ